MRHAVLNLTKAYFKTELRISVILNLATAYFKPELRSHIIFNLATAHFKTRAYETCYFEPD